MSRVRSTCCKYKRHCSLIRGIVNMYDLVDKVVIITGGANGIGAAISREMLKKGAKHVRILDLDEKAGTQLQNELNNKYGSEKSKFIKCDVTKDDQLFGAFTNTKEEQGYLDVVLNNAGVANEVDYAAIRKQIEINLIAVVNGTLKAVELMEPKNGGRGGTVINASSIAGLYPLCPPLPSYSATKSAVLLFTSCISKMQTEAIRIMTVCYGVTDTLIFNTLTSFGRAYDQELASIVTDHPKQSVESAARGTIEVYKNGKNTSVWVIHQDKPPIDISGDKEKRDAEIAKLLLQ